jgi:hypothetical protein
VSRSILIRSTLSSRPKGSRPKGFSQAVLCIFLTPDTRNLKPGTVNVMDGGTAIGHPIGATGIRLSGILVRILNAKGGRYGCANACVGGGQGVATIIEREEYQC